MLLPLHYTNNELREVYINKCIIKMSHKVREIDIKNRTYYFFHDSNYKKCFDTNNIKIDEKPHKNILIY